MTKKNLQYEKPELEVLFNDLPAAVGACTAGIGDSSACQGGASGTTGTACAGGSGGF